MNLFGVSSVELAVILIVAILVLGPAGFTQAIRGFRSLVDLAKSWSRRLREEAQRDSLGVEGFELPHVDLREYDPREIVREAVREEMEAWMKQSPTSKSRQRNDDPSSA